MLDGASTVNYVVQDGWWRGVHLISLFGTVVTLNMEQLMATSTGYDGCGAEIVLVLASWDTLVVRPEHWLRMFRAWTVGVAVFVVESSLAFGANGLPQAVPSAIRVIPVKLAEFNWWLEFLYLVELLQDPNSAAALAAHQNTFPGSLHHNSEHFH